MCLSTVHGTLGARLVIVGCGLAGTAALMALHEERVWELDQWFNLGEAWLWFMAALIFVRRRPVAVAFAVFGASDLVEVHTRAWYSPIGLAVVKGACLVVLAGAAIRGLRLARRGDDAG